MDNIKVSIIVPVFNTEKYLTKCVNSLINQTLKDIEIILVDDGSTDNSPKICDKFAENDKRIVVIHKINEGQAIARNMALDIARGEYIAFVDSDDYIAPNMFERLLFYLESENCDFSICGVINDHVITKRECPKLNGVKVWETKELLVSYLKEPYIRSVMWNKLFKKELFENLRFKPLRAKEDIEILYKIIGRSKRSVYFPEPLYYQLIRPGSTEQSGLNDFKLSFFINIYKDWQQYIKDNFPDVFYHYELMVARAYYEVLMAISKEKKVKLWMKQYNDVENQLKLEIKKYKNHNVVNEEEYKRYEYTVSNRKKILKMGKRTRLKILISRGIKKFLLLFYH